MLRIEITNDRSGEGNIANYRYRVFIGNKEIGHGEIVNHDRTTEWYGLLRDMVRQFNCNQNKPINVIWTITTVKNVTDLRKVGWYFLKEDAIQSVELNEFDMNECLSYPYAVVEGIGQGNYPTSFEQIWFKWEGSEREGKYVKLDEIPEEFKNVVNWNIG